MERNQASDDDRLRSTFIQVGITATRHPGSGEFLPSEPIFKEVTAIEKDAEAIVISDIGKIFADKMRQYIDNGGLLRSAKTKA